MIGEVEVVVILVTAPFELVLVTTTVVFSEAMEAGVMGEIELLIPVVTILSEIALV